LFTLNLTSVLTTTLGKTSGEATIAGYDIEKQAKEVRERVGIIFQKPSIDANLTAEENCRFHACLYGVYPYRPTFKMMPADYRKRIGSLAEIVGIGDQLFKPVKKLSSGQQRKFEIIRSLIHTPKILFLDEPTTGLDAMSRRGVWEYLNSVRHENGTTVFLTGAIIPIAHSSGVLFVLSRIMPMTYCLDLARSVVSAGTPEYAKVVMFDPVVNCAAIAALTAVFLAAGTWAFSRSEKNVENADIDKQRLTKGKMCKYNK
jgi:ABC-type Na+ transport system ATPase subunit NatA